jgi:hypothetical protein
MQVNSVYVGAQNAGPAVNRERIATSRLLWCFIESQHPDEAATISVV